MRIFFIHALERNNLRNIFIDNHYYEIIPEQECIPVGCVPSAAVAVSWGVCPGGVCLVFPGDGVWPGGCLPSLLGKGCVWQTPPTWTEFLTDDCENITFPQPRLRTVTSQK